jgi:phage-related protein
MTTRQWQFYEPAGGGDPVNREIRKCELNRAELAKLYTVMQRVADGRTTTGDVKALRDGVLEVRVVVANRQLRLCYAEVGEGLILLALHFFQKQRQVEDRHIDLAVSRLRDWRKRQD